MEKQITISIAAYNVEAYLEKTLSSFIGDEGLMSQLEVIIVNDGSKDRTSDIAKKYTKKYPNTFVLIDKNNGGYGSTINASLRIAKGRYFKLVDGDDWVETTELEKLIKHLKYESADLVLTRFKNFNEKTGIISNNYDSLVYDNKIKPIEDITLDKSFAMHMISYKMEVLKKINLSITENCFYTDFEYIMKPLPYIKTVSCVDLTVYVYRVGREGQSVQLASWFKNIDQGLKVSINLAEYYENVKQDVVSNKMRHYMLDSISDSAKNKYKILTMMPPDMKSKDKIVKYDAQLKSISLEVYECVGKIASSKWTCIIKLLRKTRFYLFQPINTLVREWNRDKTI